MKSPSAYNSARRNGWLDIICKHMVYVKVRQGHWDSYDNCRLEALKYKSRTEFGKKAPGAYQAAYMKGWLDLICEHYEARYKNRGHWNFDNCKEEAFKYKTRTEFIENATSAYQAANKYGWLDTICLHMESTRKAKGFWDYNNCLQEAKKFQSKSEFQKKGRGGAYAAAKKMGWLENICKHMLPQGNGFIRFAYALEFPDINEVYIGITANPARRKWQHFTIKKGKCISSNKHVRRNIEKGEKYIWFVSEEVSNKNEGKQFEEKMISGYIEKGWNVLNIAEAGALGSNRKFWTKGKCQKEAIKYTTKSDFARSSSSAYNSARENGWIDLICGHMAIKKQPNGYWDDKERCQKEAAKYKRRVDFQRGSPSASKAAKMNGWFADITKHFSETIKPVGYWNNKERCHKEALRFNVRSEFQKLSGSAYAAAQKNGWVDDICKHMVVKKKKTGFWTFENCQKEAKKYKSRTDFSLQSSSAYNTSKRNKWLDTICSHMISKQYPHGYWTFERCQEAANPYGTKMKFKNGQPKAYDAARSKGWLNTIFESKEFVSRSVKV